MNREQMIAWLTLEGWEPIYCRADRPAWGKDDACIYYDFAHMSNGAREYIPRYSAGWRQGTFNKEGTHEVYPCNLQEYTDQCIASAVELIGRINR